MVRVIGDVFLGPGGCVMPRVRVRWMRAHTNMRIHKHIHTNTHTHAHTNMYIPSHTRLRVRGMQESWELR